MTIARRSLPRAHRRRRGIALIDALVGGVILGIGLSAVISVSTTALDQQTRGEKRMTASWLADEILAMVLVEGADNYESVFFGSGRFDAPFEEFTYEVDIEEVQPIHRYEVLVTVAWGRGDKNQLSVGTIIAHREDDPDELRMPTEPLDRYERWNPDEA